MAVSMRDVAQLAGVSQRTVSNVVNDYQFVRPETRERVQQAMETLGYVPNAAARSLRAGRTGMLALVIPNFEARYFADLAGAVIHEAETLGYTVLIEVSGASHDRELGVLAGGRSQLTDGAIMSALTLQQADEHLRRPGYPLVLVGDLVFEGPVDHVGIPNREAARTAVEHLISVGCRRVMLLGTENGPTTTSKLREQGYRETLEAAGLPVLPELLLDTEWGRQRGQDAIERFVASDIELPDGIFAMNDSLALGALRALRSAGLRVPEDVAVVGFDDVEEARFASPSLTSISPAVEEIARTAVRLVHEQITGRPARTATHVLVEYELKVRESTARQ